MSSVSKAHGRIFYLDGWRALAVLSVIFAHFVTPRGINLGRMGVELFFVLSGRLMAEILFVRNTRLRDFFPRRLSRIYPALCVLALTLYALGFVSDWKGWPTFSQTLTVLSFTYNYMHVVTGMSLALNHIWSLCIEEHMYVLLGILAYFHRRRALPLVAILLGLALLASLNGALQTLAGYDYHMVYWRTDVRGASLLYGAVAYLLLARTIPVWLAPSWMPMLLVLGGLALNLNPVPDPIKYSVGSIFFAVALMLMQRAPAKVIVALENRWLVLIGTWSYSLYLWQQPFAMSTSSLGLHMALLPAAFGVALVSFYCVEQPARRFLNGLLHARRSVITEPPEIVEARRP